MSNERSGYIDQWRGISVLAVVVFHANPARFMADAPVSSKLFILAELCIAKLGPLGVYTFFVISGFLITRLLLKEEHQTGSVSLKAFYVRRATRIVPAMLVYVLAVVVMGIAGLTPLEPADGLKAASFLCNTAAVTCADQFSQLWTLGLEEQFYLIWPLLLIVCGRFRVAMVTITMVVGAIWSLFPNLAVHDQANNAMAVYCLSSGVLFALSPRFRGIFTAVHIPTWVLVIPLLFLTPIHWHAQWAFGPLWAQLIVPPILLTVVLGREGHVAGPLLSEGLRQLGLVSYSLYLWNWFALWPAQDYLSPTFRILSLLAIPFAWVSYRHIELPFIAAGQRWSKAIVAARSDPLYENG